MGTSIDIQTFDRMTLLGRRWFFRVVDTKNNETLAQSQTYKTKAQRNATANRLAYMMGCAVIPGKPR